MVLNQVALSIRCLFLKSNWQKKMPTKELNDVALYRLEMSSIKYSKHLTSRTLSPVSFFVLIDTQDLSS